MSEQFVPVPITDIHIEAFNRNKAKIVQFYGLDKSSVKLTQVGQRFDGTIHKYCQFIVKDKNNKTASLKLDLLRTKTKINGRKLGAENQQDEEQV